MTSTSRNIGVTFSEFNVVDSKSLKECVLSLNSTVHPHDPIPAWLMKQCVDDFLPILLKLVIRSLTEGVFPKPLKHAVVRPSVKDGDGDKEEFNNYRPVSNITFLSKLFEKCASKQFEEYLLKNKLYPDYQSAYRKGHSCETALFKVVNDKQRDIAKNNMVALVLLDLSSAFDTIDHTRLLIKLQNDSTFER